MEITKGKTNCKVLFVILLFSMSLYISFKNYVLFHFIIEIFCVVIASSIAILGLSSYSAKSNSLVNNIGVAYLFVAIIDFLHTLSYKGIDIISSGANVPTQLWILGRYVESFSFIIAFIWLNKRINKNKIAIVYFIITFASLYSIFFTNYFPNCYLDGIGLSKFKIISEYIIIVINIINIFLLYKNKQYFETSIVKLFIQSFIFVILGEVFFTFYFDVYGIFNALGHVFKAISYVFICHAIFFENIKAPFEKTLISYKEELEKNLNLSLNLCIDFMTGLYNRRYLDSVINNIFENNYEKTILIVFDMDNLKKINDKFGHIKGDKAILETVNILKNNFDKKDILIRLGGDEFLAIVIGSDEDGVKAKLSSIDRDLINRGNELRIPLSISYGIAKYESKIDKDIFLKLFKEADEEMYKQKAMKKNHNSFIIS